MINKLKDSFAGRKILLLGTGFLSRVNRILPKNDKRILFYDSARSHLDDNTEALYTWLFENGFDSKYDLVCCVANEKKPLEGANYTSVSIARAVLYFLTTKYVFYSFGDFRIKPSDKQVVVNQWHATLTKKIGKLTKYARYTEEDIDNFTWVLAASENVSPAMAEAFGCDESKVMLVGHARTDYMFTNKDALSPLEIDKGKYKKIILWMPTFRSSEKGDFVDGRPLSQATNLPIVKTLDDMRELDEKLKELSVLLVVKKHPFAPMIKNTFSNIIYLQNEDLQSKGIKLYEFVKEFDVLVTDYSSIYCDFLLLDRPIGFTIDDFAEYEGDRGFVYSDMLSLMPGCHIDTLNSFCSFIECMAKGEDEYAAMRRDVNLFFNSHSTRHNSADLAKLCGITLDD